MVRRFHWLALAIILMLCVGTGLRPGLPAFGPADHVSSMVPGATPVKSFRAWDVLQADGVLQFQPWRKLVIESWSRFEVPQWNPYQLCGTPLLANSQSASFYPGHIILGVLQVPWDIAMFILLVGHLVILARGLFLLTISLGARPFPAMLAALAVTFSPFVQSWSALASVPTTICWIPITMWWLRRAIKNHGNPTWVGVGVACMLLGGHLQFASYGLIAIAGFGLGHIRMNPQRAALTAIYAVSGALVSLPQVLPALEFAKLSHRAGVASETGYEAYRASSLTAREIPALIAPQVLGNPDRKATIEGVPGEVGKSWIAYLKRGGNFAESAFGLGFLICGGILLMRRVKPLIWTGAGLMVVSLLLITPSFVQRLAYFGVPGWSSTGSPGRAGILFLLGGGILASAARCVWSRPRFKWTPIIPVVLVLAAAGMAASPLEDFVSTFWICLAAVGTLVAWNIRSGVRPRITTNVITGIAVLFALVLSISGRLPGVAQSAIEPKAGERVAWINDRWNLYSTPDQALMPGNLSATLGFADVAGYDSLMSAETVAMLDAANGRASAPPENGNMLFVRLTADPVKLAELGVTRVFSREPFASLRSESVGGIFATKLDGPGILTGGTLTSRTNSRIKVEASGPVVFRERNLPGWSLTVNGQPAPLPAGPWLTAPEANAGETVEFRFTAPGLQRGLNLAALGLLVILLGGLWPKLRGKVQP